MIKVVMRNDEVVDFTDGTRYEDKGTSGLVILNESRSEVARVADGAWLWVARA